MPVLYQVAEESQPERPPAYPGRLIESILTCGITVWYGNTTQGEKKALQRVIKTAERIIGTKLPSMDSIYTENVIRDSLHPAHPLIRHNHATYNLRQSSRHYYHIHNTVPEEIFPCHSEVDGKKK